VDNSSQDHSTSLFSLGAAEFRRVTCKQIAGWLTPDFLEPSIHSCSWCFTLNQRVFWKSEAGPGHSHLILRQSCDFATVVYNNQRRSIKKLRRVILPRYTIIRGSLHTTMEIPCAPRNIYQYRERVLTWH